MDLEQKIVLITGATSGIGKAAAKQLANTGTKVVMLCRNENKAEAVREDIGRSNTGLLLCDLSDMESIISAVKKFKDDYNKLDILINNAGAVYADRRTNKNGYELTFMVNHLGHFLLTNELQDMITERVINISSSAHKFGRINFEDINFEKSYLSIKAYAQSKLANLLFTYELANKLKDVSVNCVDPGFVKTNVGQNEKKTYVSRIMNLLTPFFRTPEKGAETIVYLTASEDVKNITGKYFRNKKEISSSKRSYSKETAKRLWELSERMLQI